MTTDQTTQPLDLDAIRARAEAATPGPWNEWPAGPMPNREVGPIDSHAVALVYERGERPVDADFIACAREDIPALLAEVERLTDERDKLAATVAAIPDAHHAANLAHARAERDQLRRQLAGPDVTSPDHDSVYLDVRDGQVTVTQTTGRVLTVAVNGEFVAVPDRVRTTIALNGEATR